MYVKAAHRTFMKLTPDENNDPRECIRFECFACDRDKEIEDGNGPHGDGEDQLRPEHLGQTTSGNLGDNVTVEKSSDNLRLSH